MPATPTPSRKKRRHHLIFTWMRALCLLLALQFALMFAGLAFAGVTDHLDRNAEVSMSSAAATHAGFLQQTMVDSSWSLNSLAQSLSALYDTQLADGGTLHEALASDPALYCAYLQAAFPSLCSVMRQDNTNGAFVVLCGAQNAGQAARLPALYLRDQDPNAAYDPSANSDLLLEYCPIGLISRLGISTDTSWQPMLPNDPTDAGFDFLNKPYLDSLNAPGASYSDLAYWSAPYRLPGDNATAIAYTMPLVSGDGTVFGVVGIELLTASLTKKFSAGQDLANYFLCLEPREGARRTVLGVSTDPALTTLDTLEIGSAKDGEILEVSGEGLVPYSAVACGLSLYRSNTVNAGDRWVLYALQPTAALYETSHWLISILLAVLGLCTAAGLLLAWWVSGFLAKPFAVLENELRTAADRGSAGAPVRLSRSGIVELDSIAGGIEALNAEVRGTSAKLARIFELSAGGLGAFELDTTQKTFYLSNDFFKVFGRSVPGAAISSYPAFIAALHSLDPYLLPNALPRTGTDREYVFELPAPDGSRLWVRLNLREHGGVYTGLAQDVSIEWREMRKLEYERNHDPLTAIFNRRAFHEKLNELFTHPEAMHQAAMIMLDLDSLKYINDTYGHDMGDNYIRAAAQAFSLGAPAGALVARMSGDEFMVFLYGFADMPALQSAVEGIENQIRRQCITLPDGAPYPVRASAGVALYPQDSTDPAQLIRYADFAMYKGKHSAKGHFIAFDHAAYASESYLLQGKEALNQLIEQELVDYYFQPIVDTHTGEVFGYEALMRSQLRALSSPLEILTLARQESKLGAIEHLSWFKAAECFTHCLRTHSVSAQCRLFINSISNQILSDEDMAAFAARYRALLPRLVMELTEDEQNSLPMCRKKLAVLDDWHAQIALDDFGTGYNTESTLLAILPNFLKLDIGMVRDIDTDANKQQLVRSVIRYAHDRGVRLIGEGVETKEELRQLIRMNVDYVQGFYLAQPAHQPPKPSPRLVLDLLPILPKE